MWKLEEGQMCQKWKDVQEGKKKTVRENLCDLFQETDSSVRLMRYINVILRETKLNVFLNNSSLTNWLLLWMNTLFFYPSITKYASCYRICG